MRTATAPRWVGIGLATALAGAGCVACSDHADLPEGDKPVQAVAVSAKPQWDSRGLGMDEVTATELRGDVAVVAGKLPATGRYRLAVVDADSGMPHWSVVEEDPLDDSAILADDDSMTGISDQLLIVGAGAGWSVLVAYQVLDSDDDVTEHGVAALSGADGSVRWRTKLPGTAGLSLLSAQAGTALAAVSDRESGRVRTFALDPGDGSKRWTHRGDWLYAPAGDVVLGEHPAEDGWRPDDGKPNDGGWVLAVDAKTGQQKWSFKKRYDTSGLAGTVPGRAVVTVEKPKKSGGMVVDTTTGRRLHSLPEDYYHCTADGRELLACADVGSEPKLVTIRAGKHDDPVTAEQAPDGTLDLVDDNRIYASGTTNDDNNKEQTQSAVVDRAGNVLRDKLPGSALAASARHGAFLVPTKDAEHTRLAVYRMAVGDKRPASPKGPGRPTVKPLSYHKKPLWTATAENGQPTSPGRQAADTGLHRLDSVQLVGDTVLYSGINDDEEGRWVAADAKTGTIRWTHRSNSDPYYGSTHSLLGSLRLAGPHQETLLIQYGNRDEGGVLALSMKDGHTLWKKRVGTGTHFLSVVDADESTFVVSDRVYHDGNRSTTRTHVYDLDSQRELLAKDNVAPQALVDDTVFGLGVSPSDDSSEHADNPLVALDVRSGKEKWRLRDRYRNVSVMGESERALVVSRTHGGSVVLDPTTGRELAHTSTHLTRCRGDARPLLVCQAGDGDVPAATYPVVIDLRKHGAGAIRELMGHNMLTDYQATGRWFFGQHGSKGRYRAMDARGRTVSTGLPGCPIISDRYVVFIEGIQAQSASGLTLSVHRR